MTQNAEGPGAPGRLSSKTDGAQRRFSIDGWRRLNPTWKVKLLDTSAALKLAPEFARIHRREAAVEDQGKVCIQLQADLLRTELLSLYGGVWADTSVLPVHPLDDWLEGKLALAGFWSFLDEMEGVPSNKSVVGSCLTQTFAFGTKKGGIPAYVHQHYHSTQTALNWFLAADRPHHPLIDAWLHAYVSNQ